MTEYRIVCTRDTINVGDGKKAHLDVASCTWGGTFHRLQTFDENKAKELLKMAKEKCAEYDKISQTRTNWYDVHYWQTDIRIQTREVTDWK